MRFQVVLWLDCVCFQEGIRLGRKAEESFAHNVLHTHYDNDRRDIKVNCPRSAEETPFALCFDIEKPLEPVKPLCLQQYELYMSQAVVGEVGGRW